MPNHVAVEVIFRNVDDEAQKRILSVACNPQGEIDFSVLLPVPLNCWMGGVGTQHKIFPDNGLDWCTKNWGTKWGPYDLGPNSIIPTTDSLTFHFSTAWRPPYGWLVALYNKLSLPIEYNWLSEGEERGHSGRFDPSQKLDEWKEEPCDDEMQKHLHLQRWGCESFPEETEEAEL